MMMMALGANFLGVTSLVLSKNFEGFARDARLDVVYAVNGYRREVNEEKGYECLFPNEYLADQTVAEGVETASDAGARLCSKGRRRALRANRRAHSARWERTARKI